MRHPGTAWIDWVILGLIILCAIFMVLGTFLHAQPNNKPVITSSQVQSTNGLFNLTLERDDFPPATQGQTVFQTTQATHGKFVIVYRNGALQRACTPGQQPTPGLCDYTVSGNMTVTYLPAGSGPQVLWNLVTGRTVVQFAGVSLGDLVTLFYYNPK